MFPTVRTARTVAVAATAAAIGATSLASTASAATPPSARAAAAPCQVSPFHMHAIRYRNVKKLGSVNKFMPRSQAFYNPSTLGSSMTITYGRSSTWTGTASTSMRASFGAFGTAVEAEVGISVSYSRSVDRSVAFTLAIPPKQWGWIVPVMSGVRLQATQESVDVVCNKVTSRRTVLWTGPLNRTPDMIGRTSRARPM